MCKQERDKKASQGGRTPRSKFHITSATIEQKRPGQEKTKKKNWHFYWTKQNAGSKQAHPTHENRTARRAKFTRHASPHKHKHESFLPERNSRKTCHFRGEPNRTQWDPTPRKQSTWRSRERRGTCSVWAGSCHPWRRAMAAEAEEEAWGAGISGAAAALAERGREIPRGEERKP
jgi:hypothetical protein